MLEAIIFGNSSNNKIIIIQVNRQKFILSKKRLFTYPQFFCASLNLINFINQKTLQ